MRTAAPKDALDAELRRVRNSFKASERMKRLHADPEFRKEYKLPPRNPEQRRVYTKLRPVVGRDRALLEAMK